MFIRERYRCSKIKYNSINISRFNNYNNVIYLHKINTFYIFRSLQLRQPLPQGPEACPLPLTHVEYPGCYWKERWYKECKNYFQKFTYRKEFVVWLINLQVLLQWNKSSPIQWVFSQIDQALKMKRINTSAIILYWRFLC